MQRTIFDSELEHCINLLLLDRNCQLVRDDMQKRLFHIEQLYEKETIQYWRNRYNEVIKYDR